MAYLKEHLEKQDAELDKALEDIDESIAWSENSLAQRRGERAELVEKKAEIAEALAKLYPPRQPQSWKSLTLVPMDIAVTDFWGFLWKVDDTHHWTRYDKAGNVMFKKTAYSEKYCDLGPFTEVLDGAK